MRWLVFGIVVLVSALYLHSFAYKGWIPHDEGLLAHSAERVGDGQLPHRDYDETYTGGLAYWHHFAFRVFGTRLSSIRTFLLILSIAFIAATYWIAIRFVPSWAAGLLSLLALVWSVPNYFASMPSWYNLFCATSATLCLIQFTCSRKLAWVFAAGLLTGLSVLAKVTGLYFLAAALLFLVYREHIVATEKSAENDGSTHCYPFAVFTSCFLLAFVTALNQLVAGDPTKLQAVLNLSREQLSQERLMRVIHYVVPGAAIALLLAWSEWTSGRGFFVGRIRRLVTYVTPLLVGFAVPVGLFLIPYFGSGAFDDFYRGLFVLPQKRLSNAFYLLPKPETLTSAFPLMVLLVVPLFVGLGRKTRFLVWGIAGTLAVVGAYILLVAVGQCSQELSIPERIKEHQAYQWIWNSVRPIVPLAAVIGCVALALRKREDEQSDALRSQVVLLIAAGAMASIVQFPYAVGIYFCYAAPLVFLALVAAIRAQDRPPWSIHTVVLGFYALFGLLLLNPAYVRGKGLFYIKTDNVAKLDWERGGLVVDAPTEELYRMLREEVIRHSEEGAFIYAAPDCPEVYFLNARENPTRTMYDFFDEPEGRVERIVKAIDEQDVKVVVINLGAEFTPPYGRSAIDPALFEEIKRRFPGRDNRKRVGQFQVRWRE